MKMTQTPQSEALAADQFNGFGGATRVHCRQEDLQWLREFFCPSLQCGLQEPVTETVLARTDPSLYEELHAQFESSTPRDWECFTLDGRFETFPGCRTTDGDILISLDRFRLMLRMSHSRQTCELTAAHPAAKFRLGLMRIVRELATVRAIRAGAVPFHGAVCADPRGSTGFLGVKTAGKSTSLVHSLQSSSRYFVANDRFFVSDTPVGLIASGMPTIVRIRSGTLRLFPQLAERAEAVPYHRERTLNEIQNHPGPPSRDEEASSFSQAQFLKILGRTALTRSPLQSILFPVRDDSLQAPVFVPLSVEDVTRQLMMNLLSPGPRLLTSEVFDPSSDREIPREQIEQMCRRIASRTSCHQYRQGLQTISLPASLPALSHCA